MPENPEKSGARREWLKAAGVVIGGVGLVAGGAREIWAKDYASRLQALNELDRLAAVCGMRLGALRRSRTSAGPLAARFLAALSRHRATRNEVRLEFALPPGKDPALELGSVDEGLVGLRGSLDELMNAYAESLPAFGNARVVSRLAIDMVEVSKLRTVIDLWVEAEAA
jgi:hypothetical protein